MLISDLEFENQFNEMICITFTRRPLSYKKVGFSLQDITTISDAIVVLQLSSLNVWHCLLVRRLSQKKKLFFVVFVSDHIFVFVSTMMG